MSHFMNLTISDLRGGRQTWRVFLLVCAPSFATALVAATLAW
jgi:hypothetical protein